MGCVQISSSRVGGIQVASARTYGCSVGYDRKSIMSISTSAVCEISYIGDIFYVKDVKFVPSDGNLIITRK